MNERGKSDSPIVPGKLPNKGRGALRFAEEVEGRGLAEGNLFQQPKFRTQSRTDLQNALRLIRQANARHCPRQEPSAVVPLAGICPGGTG